MPARASCSGNIRPADQSCRHHSSPRTKSTSAHSTVISTRSKSAEYCTQLRNGFMAKKIIVHIVGEDPVQAEIEQQPQPTDNFLIVTNLRRRDGKDVNYLAPGCEQVLFPWSRITFIEFMVDETDHDNVVDFFRLD